MQLCWIGVPLACRNQEQIQHRAWSEIESVQLKEDLPSGPCFGRMYLDKCKGQRGHCREQELILP